MFALAWAFLPFSLSAQALLKPETLWDFTRIAEHKISPDGKTIAFTASTYSITDNKGNAELYVLPVTGGNPLKITTTPGSEFNPRWRPDGKKIGYLSAESGNVQLWEINPDGTEKKQVSDITGGIANFNYAPGGQYVYFTMDVKTGKTVQDLFPDLPKANARIEDGLMYRHWNHWEDEFSSHVFYAAYQNGSLTGTPTDIMPGEPFDAPLSPFGGEEQLSMSADGKWLAYTAKKLTGTAYATSTNSDIYLYDREKGTTANLSEKNTGYDIEPSFSPDGKYIVWLSMKTPGFEADKNRIILYEIATGTSSELLPDFDQSAGHLVWSKDSKTLYFTSGIKGTYQLYAVTLKNPKIAVQITNGVHDLTSFELAADGKENGLITTRTSMSSPAELWKVNPATGAMQQLTFLNKPVLDQLKLATVKERTVKTTDGKDMLVWVIYPPDFDASKKYPTLLYCQGGPQSMVSQSFSYRWNFQLMAANGYIIVAPNRRGLPGFGQEWNDQISGDWGGQAMQDLLSAIDDVSKEPYVDVNRRGAIGASFGGYSVYWLAGNHEGRFKSLVSHCGVFNLESMYGHTEEVFFSNHDFGGPFWENANRDLLERFSPHNYVEYWDTPLLVIHNEKDYRVPLSEGMQAFTAAQVKGIKSRFLYFEDEGHWVTKPQNSILWQRVFFNWLKETL